jgi:hypothetical protein
MYLSVFLCPHTGCLWNELSKPLEHPLRTQKISDTAVIYGYKRSDNTAQQLANFLLTVAKRNIFKTYMAAVDTDGRSAECHRLLPLRGRYSSFSKCLRV